MCEQVRMVKRVTVLLSEEEYAQVRISANKVPLSRYFKNLALGVKQANGETNRIPDMQSNSAIRAPIGRDTVPARIVAALDEQTSEVPTASKTRGKRAIDRLPVLGEKLKPSASVKTCAHGIAKGFNCWQCKGLAKIE